MDSNSLMLIPIYEDIKEYDFPRIIRNYNFRAIRICNKNRIKIEHILKDKINDFFFDLKLDIFGTGMPDFLIWNKNDYYFCEFKSKTDSFHSNQLNWFSLHPEYNKAIAYVLVKERNQKIKKIPKDLYFDVMNKNLTKILNSELYTSLVKEYCKKNPYCGMFYYKEYDNYFGMIDETLKEILIERGCIQINYFKDKHNHIQSQGEQDE